MGKVYVQQTRLRIILDTGVYHDGVDIVQVRYRKPDGTEGSWDAALDPDDSRKVYYDVQSTSDLDQSGEWQFWAYVRYTNGEEAYGEPASVYVWEQGE